MSSTSGSDERDNTDTDCDLFGDDSDDDLKEPSGPPSPREVPAEPQPLAAAYFTTMNFRLRLATNMVEDQPAPPCLLFDIWTLIFEFVCSAENYKEMATNTRHRRSLAALAGVSRFFRYIAERSQRWEGWGYYNMVNAYLRKTFTPKQKAVRDRFKEAIDGLDVGEIVAAASKMDSDLPIEGGSQLFIPSMRLISAHCLRMLETSDEYGIRYALKAHYYKNMPNWRADNDYSILLEGPKPIAEKPSAYSDRLPKDHWKRIIPALKALIQIGWCDVKTEPLLFYAYYGYEGGYPKEHRNNLVRAICEEIPGVNVNLGTYGNGYTALHECVEEHDAEMAAYLLSRGADPNLGLRRAFSSSHAVGTTALMVARQEADDHPCDETRAVLEVLAKAGYDV